MRRICLLLVASLGVVLFGTPACAQEKEKLKTEGFGSVVGKVTFVGELPKIIDLKAKMMLHQDKACCLAGKPGEMVDQTWIIDPKTKAVENVAIWISPPKDTYLAIHPKYKKRKEMIVVDQPNCAFVPRVSAFNPVFFDGKEYVATGQQLHIKNSATVSHNVRVIGHPLFNEGFNKTLQAKTTLDCMNDLEEKQKLKPQVLPISLQCDLHPWMAGKLFVFDHPHYAITNADGKFEISAIPAGAQVSIVAWHEGLGWALKGGKAGAPITIKNGETTTFNIELTLP
ncbi:MAG: hypothetical protein FJ303_22090 [Planctomycetes bacterium]|nr:hypothetical protein [Planctomycetota bacterium]